MDEGSTLLLGLDGVVVDAVRVGADGVRTVQVSTAARWVARCTACGCRSSRSKGKVVTFPRDVKVGPGFPRLVWVKRKWLCINTGCDRKVFTEAVPQIPARARITGRAKVEIAEAVLDDLRSISQVTAAYGCSWNVGQAAVDAVVADRAAQDEHTGLPRTEAIGLDETRRGKARWQINTDTGERVWVDRFDTGIVDIAGGGGLLGQVPGRSAAAVTEWIGAQDHAWRASVGFVAIDMSASYARVARTALPHATIVVDPFHLVQRANTCLDQVRRRVTRDHRGRRGRRTDPEWRLRRRLLRNAATLDDSQQSDLLAALNAADPTDQILAAWIAKELLCDVLAATSIDDVSTQRRELRARLHRFYQLCADTSVDELHQLAATIDTWQAPLIAAVTSGYSNAASEGHNRIVKHVGRQAFGFRNREHQRARVASACTRRRRWGTSRPRRMHPC